MNTPHRAFTGRMVRGVLCFRPGKLQVWIWWHLSIWIRQALIFPAWFQVCFAWKSLQIRLVRKVFTVSFEKPPWQYSSDVGVRTENGIVNQLICMNRLIPPRSRRKRSPRKKSHKCKGCPYNCPKGSCRKEKHYVWKQRRFLNSRRNLWTFKNGT